MNQDIVSVGDLVEYNGNIDNIDNIQTPDRRFIKRRLEIGTLYELIQIHHFSDGCWYKVKYGKYGVWAPKDCFDIKIDMKKKYGLR